MSAPRGGVTRPHRLKLQFRGEDFWIRERDTCRELYEEAASELGLPTPRQTPCIVLRLPDGQQIPYGDEEPAVYTGRAPDGAVSADMPPRASLRSSPQDASTAAALNAICDKIDEVVAAVAGAERDGEAPMQRVKRFGALIAHRSHAVREHGFEDARDFARACESQSEQVVAARDRLAACEARWQAVLDKAEDEVAKGAPRLREGDAAPPFELSAVHWHRGKAGLADLTSWAGDSRRGDRRRCSLLVVFLRHFG